ncbi:RdRP-domain-containing protein [Xylona heveae TC161]|uniref:RNA-directed RNA polymerase n=1 Tax=Xylona heveae (strain CBS 132557 / TC161) TaxID=1328760 RepID=A0A165AHB7_XYLHT|nr:RdRP-domain-containing protein [Xylona heveae TC161]KZF20474.1 RdRP-domain-containing protein [Xylona heveae TC161]
MAGSALDQFSQNFTSSPDWAKTNHPGIGARRGSSTQPHGLHAHPTLHQAPRGALNGRGIALGDQKRPQSAPPKRPITPQAFRYAGEPGRGFVRGGYSSHRGTYGRRGKPSAASPWAFRQHQSIKPVEDWSNWTELGVKVSGLPSSITTLELYRMLIDEGPIETIEIFESTRGTRDGVARVRFSPPPRRSFWLEQSYAVETAASKQRPIAVELEPKRRTFLHPSPLNPSIKYPERTTLLAEALDFGFLYDESTMMAMRNIYGTSQSDICFTLNLIRREIDIRFNLHIQDPRRQIGLAPKLAGTKPAATVGSLDRIETYRFRIPFAQCQRIFEMDIGDDKKVLIVPIDTPPNFFRRVKRIEATHDERATFWNEWETWRRQTDVLYAPNQLRHVPLTLKKGAPIIDIGRWTTYRFVFSKANNDWNKYAVVHRALRDYNVEMLGIEKFALKVDPESSVWEFIDRPSVRDQNSGSFLEDMAQLTVPPLSFPVRYQLEVCISQGCLNEHNISKAFVDALTAMDAKRAQDLLEHVASQKRRFYDPMEIFTLKYPRVSQTKIPHYCAEMRSATVTPTMVYYNSPSIETSNRVVRRYIEHSDRFLRVRFSDEKYQGRINAIENQSNDEIFTRIKRILANGITIGDRHYEFLAFGNSQFHEHGAYFFARLPHLNAADIRLWMGKFDNIKVIAKYAARIGQCFSTTRAINGTRVEIKELQDIQRNGYNFTDGVGKISPFLATIVASELELPNPQDPPSVFQFRLGGCKGVLAISPDAKKNEIHIRESQYKFAAAHNGLEIIRWSQFAAASLNRQIILVLSALGVPDEVFVNKLKGMLSDLEQAMSNQSKALHLLQKYVDPNQMTMNIANMILDGFQQSNEPFVASLLHLWRAWSIKYLKEKAKILIEDGAFVLGCVDETGILNGHYDKQDRRNVNKEAVDLPEIFIQVSDQERKDGYVVIEGPCLLARNPSLHPGDVRVVRAVNVPELYHLKNVVVLPQTGDRDVASMCSGGDLDGDDYLVIWDQELTPTEWNYEPMDYTPPNPAPVDEVTIDHITSFFVTYMKNDRLPTIATSHMAHADYLDTGVKDRKCLQLAALHSKAVDYTKTGEPARMPRELRARKWPHFMEKNHVPKEQIYVSRKVLGQLYDQVQRVDFVPHFESKFDERILGACQTRDEDIKAAAMLKEEYDAAMRRIMAQYQIDTEFEVWSTFLMSHANASKDYKFHEEMGVISSGLKQRFKQACFEKAGTRDVDGLVPFVVAMYKVTEQQLSQALEESRRPRTVAGQEEPSKKINVSTMPLISFPWLFDKVLGRIANGELPGRHGQATERLPPESMEGHPPIGAHLAKPINLGELGLEGDSLETNEGVTHRGEMLQLFQHGDRQEQNSNRQGSGAPLAEFDRKDMDMLRQNPHTNVVAPIDKLGFEDVGPHGMSKVPQDLEVEIWKSTPSEEVEMSPTEAAEDCGHPDGLTSVEPQGSPETRESFLPRPHLLDTLLNSEISSPLLPILEPEHKRLGIVSQPEPIDGSILQREDTVGSLGAEIADAPSDGLRTTLSNDSGDLLVWEENETATNNGLSNAPAIKSDQNSRQNTPDIDAPSSSHSSSQVEQPEGVDEEEASSSEEEFTEVVTLDMASGESALEELFNLVS